MTKQTAIVKQSGVTSSERHLSTLCAKSFLSLWSYPGVCRDQGKAGQGDGKEICDLLVVFGDDIAIFSDKDCQFPDSGRLDVDWSRWFRRAVQKSAEQVWGAERWIKDHPNRVFVDRLCTQRLPVSLPNSERIRVHRIVVAHDAARRCQELLGGSGSLVILPMLKGDAHVAGPVAFPDCEGDLYEGWEKGLKQKVGYAKTVLPFTVGDLDPDRGFVHVFDDTGLAVVMAELDTTADFLLYLSDREKYVRSGRLLMAAGEDDLLAHYLQEVDGYSVRSFHVPDDPEAKVIIPEGEWSALQADSSWKTRKQVDKVSYVWDIIIERLSTYILDGSSAAYPFADLRMQELAVRALAREPRFHRRILACALGDFLQHKRANAIAARVANPIRPRSPYYVLLAVQPETGEPYEQYREKRWAIAWAYLIEAKRKFASSEVVVIATETPGWSAWATEDVLYRGHEPLSAEEIESVREFVEAQGVLTKLGKELGGKALEYPRVQDRPSRLSYTYAGSQRIGRNSLCPCGSGLKFKKCCLRR